MGSMIYDYIKQLITFAVIRLNGLLCDGLVPVDLEEQRGLRVDVGSGDLDEVQIRTSKWKWLRPRIRRVLVGASFLVLDLSKQFVFLKDCDPLYRITIFGSILTTFEMNNPFWGKLGH